MENEVCLLLKNNSINFEQQKRFKWLGRQSLDFYLPEYKIGIEYQGAQHFENVKRFGGGKTLEKTQERDLRKQEKCKELGILLLYVVPEKYYGKNSQYMLLPGEIGKNYRRYKDSVNEAAEHYVQKQKQERIASSYKNAAKREMNSIKEDIKSDVSSAAKNAKKKVKSVKKKLSSKTKEYIIDNKTGEKRPVVRTGETINIKELAEKNKKKKK